MNRFFINALGMALSGVIVTTGIWNGGGIISGAIGKINTMGTQIEQYSNNEKSMVDKIDELNEYENILYEYDETKIEHELGSKENNNIIESLNKANVEIERANEQMLKFKEYIDNIEIPQPMSDEELNKLLS